MVFRPKTKEMVKLQLLSLLIFLSSTLRIMSNYIHSVKVKSKLQKRFLQAKVKLRRVMKY